MMRLSETNKAGTISTKMVIWNMLSALPILAFGFSLIVAQVQAPQTQAPATMTKMVVRLMGPGIRAGSHAALPRTIYRASPHYARIEDPPDSRQLIEKVTVIAEPDAYSANLIDKHGTHAIDQGGPNDLHLPIVLPFDPKHKLGILDRLEFGAELDFFEQAGATKKAGPIINAKPTDAYVLETPQHATATLVMNPEKNTPITLSWKTEDGTYTYEYISYEEVPFDGGLFTKPAGIAYREIPPEPEPAK
jgi:hypothetical protein